MKKSLAVLLLIAAIWCGFQIDLPRKSAGCCPFCDPAVLARQKVFQGKGALALLSHKPAAAGHMLIIPERHVERFEDLTETEMAEIHAMIRKVDRVERTALGSTGYVLLQKNGSEAGQSVPHVHFHYLPRSIGESHLLLAARIFISSWLKPLNEEEIHSQSAEFVAHDQVLSYRIVI